MYPMSEREGFYNKNEFGRYISKNTPFVIYLHDMISHLNGASHIDTKGTFPEVHARTMQEMDKTVGALLQALEDNNQLSNTVIIGYGDHGDDFFTHGYYGGYSHSIPPFTSVCWTPAFIFDSSAIKDGAITHKLCSTVDYNKTSLNLLGIDDSILENKHEETINILDDSDNRKFAFSQSIMAAQKDHPQGLKRSYSITSDYYHLLAIEGEKNQMFQYTIDSTNGYNIFDTFEYGLWKDGTKKYVQKVKKMHGGYAITFRNGYWLNIIEEMKRMSSALESFISFKNEIAMQSNSDPFVYSLYKV